jgi:EAL domain-containing protein (putative c-di-GMP-specific phosphodiesterase class I)
LAHELNMDVVVEGVETDAQLEMLKGWGAKTVQGWLFSKALAAPAVSALLQHPYMTNVSPSGSPAASIDHPSR